MVQSLLEKEADHAVRDMLEKLTLHWAAVARSESSVRMLPDRESNTTYDHVTAQSIIQEAALGGQTTVVKMLLLHISDV